MIGKDVSYSHLQVSGCKVFVHVPNEQRLKLNDKASPCNFIGYGNAKFGYRLLDTEKKTIIKIRDVVFCENQNITNLKKSESI